MKQFLLCLISTLGLSGAAFGQEAAAPILDLDANHGVTLEDGDRVSKWQNQVADARARDFVKRDRGRKKAGSGRPTLRKAVKELHGQNSIQFLQQELVCMDEDAFDHLTQGGGATWLSVISVREQRVGLKDVNSFFGNLKNSKFYGGLWGALTDDNTLWWGMRNGKSFGRFDENNPQLLGPKLEVGKYYVVAGRIGAGTGEVELDLFVNKATPVSSAKIAVNPKDNPSKLAIGQERDAIQHPGKESFDGEIARFMIFDRPLTDAELAKQISTLQKRYGISSEAKPKSTKTPAREAAATQAKKPNIVFIMADDLGAGWVDYDGSNPEINTPNLQRLAENGMVFTKAYAACPVCSPTRAACITGMSPARIGMTTHIPGKKGWVRPGPKGGPRDAETLYHLPLDLPSYARELKKLGYVTGFLGKWHLAGDGSVGTKDGIVNRDWHPEHYGFDRNIGGCAYGQPKSWFDPYRNGTIKDRKKGEYLTDRLGDEAASFIRANASTSSAQDQDKPFHLSLWPYSVHTPIKAPGDLVKKNGGDAFRAMLESLDGAVGKVLDTLEATGTLENTMVVFYSDNGGHFPTKWLADKKASLLEGGLRVPMVVSWPGVIKGGTTCSVPVNSMDFFPTFVHAAGGSIDSITPLEGLDLKPLFEGQGRPDRDALYWHFPHNRMEVSHYMGGTILEGDWKFYRGYGLIEDKLFNLKDDPMERTNVLAKNPELAKRLHGKLNNWLKEVSAKMPGRADGTPRKN